MPPKTTILGIPFQHKNLEETDSVYGKREEKPRVLGVKDEDNAEPEQKESSKRMWNGTQEKLIQIVLKAMGQDGEHQDSTQREKLWV